MKRISVAATVLSILGFVAPAFANPNFAITTRDGRISQKTCMDKAKQAAQVVQLTNVEINSNSVVGDSQEYSVLILCHALSVAKGATTQIIMVAGPDGNQAADIRSRIKTALDK